jgi:hypothetical protein
MSTVVSTPLVGALRARVGAKGRASARRAAAVRPVAATKGANADAAPAADAARVAVAALASVVVALPAVRVPRRGPAATPRRDARRARGPRAERQHASKTRRAANRAPRPSAFPPSPRARPFRPARRPAPERSTSAPLTLPRPLAPPPSRPQTAAPVAEIALTADEQIAAEISKYDAMKAACKNQACRDTTQSWEDAAVNKIKKKNGIAVSKPAPKAYPAAPKTAPAPAAAPAAPAPEPPAPAPTPKAEWPVADAKAEAKARLAERQAASAAAAEKAQADKAAKAAAAKKAAEDAAAEKAEAIRAQAAAAEAKRAEKAAEKAAAAAPKAEKKTAPAASKPAPAPKKTAPKPKSPGVGDYVVGDVAVAALAAAAGVALAKPSVKDKALGGDVEGALEDAKEFVAGVEGVVGKAAYLGGIVLADALTHLPVLGFFLPGPAEYVGACAAVLLAARYYVTEDGTVQEDLANFGKSLPQGLPDVADVTEPVTALVGKLSAPDFEELKGDAVEWFNGLDDPVETIAPPAAALGAAYALVSVAHFPVIGLVVPRLLELGGVAVAAAAVEKYGNTSADVKKDLGEYAARGGDAVKTLISK